MRSGLLIPEDYNQQTLEWLIHRNRRQARPQGDYHQVKMWGNPGSIRAFDVAYFPRFLASDSTLVLTPTHLGRFPAFSHKLREHKIVPSLQGCSGLDLIPVPALGPTQHPHTGYPPSTYRKSLLASGTRGSGPSSSFS